MKANEETMKPTMKAEEYSMMKNEIKYERRRDMINT